VVRPGKVRRAKLYYLRDKIGKSAKIKELIAPRKADAAAKPEKAAPAADPTETGAQ
jgi:large subunit ribosomal protein L19